MNTKDLYRRIVGITMTQMSKTDKYAQVSVSEGIKRHSDKAVAAVLTEFSQFNDKQVFEPCDAKQLTKPSKREALSLITMIKQKRDGKIQGCAFADGHKQHRYIKRDEVSSPTVQLESLMITLLVDAHERRNVATADILGAYLLADMDDYTIVKISGSTADIMCEVDPVCREFIVQE